MIRRTYRRAATVLGAAVVLTAAGLPLISGTARAATVSAAPTSANNAGDVNVTLTAGATMFTATGATLTKHSDSSVVINASSLTQPNPVTPTKRVATFPLLNKLPGLYDITVNEPGGNETCTSCFTINGLPPTVKLVPPATIVTGSTATGTLTLSNPARGDSYPTTRVRMEFSGVAGLKANKMSLTANIGNTSIPTALTDSGGDVVAFVGPPEGLPLGQNQTYAISLVFGAVSSAPTGSLSIATTFGDVNPSTGQLTDTLAQDLNEPSAISSVAAGGTYHAITPVRVLDTRNSLGGHPGALPSGGSLTLVVGGKNGVPTTATAAVVNVLATGGNGSGFLVVYPAGATKPVASNVDYVRGSSNANLAVVPLSASTHALTIANGGGATVHVLCDVVGYYATTTGGAVYHPLAPARVLDTRTGSGTPIAANGSRTLTIAGTGGVPASGATVVAVNVAATRGQRTGFLRLYPTGGTQPATSDVDYLANQSIANLALVQLSSDGRLTIVNHSSGTVHVLVDVQGYFDSGSGSSLHPSTISRVLDTRFTGSRTPLAGNGTMTIGLGGQGGVPSSGITMVALNVTVVQPRGGGHIIVYSDLDSRPVTSNANFTTGQTIANLAYVKTSDSGGIKIYNGSSQPIDLIVDVEGWGSSP